MPPKTMILWSGGVESTHLLKRLLTETDEHIVAHHINIENPEKERRSKELHAISVLYPQLAAIRPFDLSYSKVSVCNGQAYPNDIRLTSSLGVIAMYHHNCTQIHRAQCYEDKDLRYELDGVQMCEEYDERVRWESEWWKYLRPLLKEPHTPEMVAPYLPSYSLTKRQQMDYLGEMLSDTWSCRRPDHGNPCGTCHACIMRNV